MTCASCGTEIPEGARYCPACGRPVGADARTGDAVQAASPPSAARERKVATILFADLVGYTGLNETHDPELVQALVSRAFDRLSAEVERYEGLVEKFAGDAMLAVFGVPQVHEDDPERAVRAAIEMQAAMGELANELEREGRPSLALRIGLETGEVLVDLGRAVSERDRIVTGDPVNVAARLEQAANQGAVLVGPSAYAATRDVVDYEELPPIALKGKALPVAAWRAVSVKARRGGARARLGMEAPLVGREEELSLLKQTVRRAVADGRSHLVTVVASAGVGKSRLAWELEKYLDGLPETFHWRKGRCLAYGQASYSALADVVKTDAGLRDDDPPANAIEKLDARLREVGGEALDATAGAALQALLGLGGGEDATREGLFESWRRYLEVIARRAPLVAVFEDVHWADEGLLDFLEFLARWGEAPILILALARHELFERRPAWGGGVPNATTLVLEPLPAQQSGLLVDGLLGEGMPASLREHVIALADGNPLFTEELIRMFVDRGVLRHVDGRWQLARPMEEIEIPGSVHAVLAARLDGLPSTEKRIAQDAAVVGRVFWDAVVAHLENQGRGAVGDLLRRLRVKELVVPREPSTLAGAAEFSFRHVLIRDVAYESLPKRERAGKHLDVARWAEAELAERKEEFIELLAEHFLSALRYEEEFSTDAARTRELRERTLDYARRASGRAARLHEAQSAARWARVAYDLGQALGLGPEVEAELAEEFINVGWRHTPGHELRPVAERAVSNLLALERLSPDTQQRLARLRSRLAAIQHGAGETELARQTLRGGIEALRDGPPTAGRALLISRLGWLSWRVGPAAEAPALLERAIGESRASRAADVERAAIHDLGVARWILGELEGSVELISRSMELAREAEDHELLMRCYNNLPGVLEALTGESDAPVRITEEGLRIARRRLERGNAAWLAANLSELLIELGRSAEALAYAEEALEWAEGDGGQVLVATKKIELEWIRWLRGNRDSARILRGLLASVPAEPQNAVWYWFWEAIERWPSEPRQATALFCDRLAGTEANLIDGARDLMRMAMRVGDADLLNRSREHVRRALERRGAGRWPAQRRWLESLALEPSLARAGVLAAAEELEARGYRIHVAAAYADAAILAARAGLDPEPDIAKARAVYAECELVPHLGELPETRWMTREVVRTETITA